MIWRLIIGPALLLSIMASSLAQNAAQKPIVRIEIEPETVTVGQPARLRITLLGPTWFSKPPVYPTFELPNAITRLPPNSSFPTSERIGGETWSGIVRTYQIYPLLAAPYELSGQSIEIAYADPQTQNPVQTTIGLPVIRFSGRVPKGAEALDPFLAGKNLTLTQQVVGETDSIAIGDAIVRTVMARLEGMPVMFLPRLIDGEPIDGTSTMAKEPSIEEKSGNRGGPLVSTRSESMTYVFETEGDRVLPAIELSWWNTETKKIKTASVPEISVSVIVPETRFESEVSGGALDRILAISPWQITCFVFVSVGLWVAAAYRRRIGAFLAERLSRHRASEPVCFRRLNKSVRSGSVAEIDRALRGWMAHFPPVGAVGDLARRAGRSDIAIDLNLTIAGSFGREGKVGAALSPTARLRIAGAVKKLRTELKKRPSDRASANGAKSRLNALNP